MPTQCYSILIFLSLVFCACSTPPQTKELHGRWLHRTEREGLDFSPQGLLCHYTLSPQKILFYKFETDEFDLHLKPIGQGQAEDLVYPFNINEDTLALHTRADSFRNFIKTKEEKLENPWPELHGLWRGDGEKRNQFLNFTEWGTVYGMKEVGTGKEAQLRPLWAKYKIYKSRAGLKKAKRKIATWGIHGKESLSGNKRKIEIDGQRLLFDGGRYSKKTSIESLGE